MRILWKRNKKLSMLIILLLILTVIPPLPALAVRQGNKSVNIADTNISQIINKAYTGKKQFQKPVIMDGRYYRKERN